MHCTKKRLNFKKRTYILDKKKVDQDILHNPFTGGEKNVKV